MKIDKNIVAFFTPCELAWRVCRDAKAASAMAKEIRSYGRRRRREIERSIGSKYVLWPD